MKPSPELQALLSEARESFDGSVEVLKLSPDGTKALVRMSPDPKPEIEGGADWGRMIEPTVVLFDPAMIRKPRPASSPVTAGGALPGELH